MIGSRCHQLQVSHVSSIQQLNNQYGLSDKLIFTSVANDQPIVQINTHLCTAKIALQGAQVFAWVPVGEHAVIWLSEQAVFAPGKSLRGGVPVCWPWFGAHSSRKDVPAHGYARTVNWSVRESKLREDGAISLVFALEADAKQRDMWPYDCELQLQMTIGNVLDLSLVTVNTGKQAFTISEALHTYFAVGDIRRTQIQGLDKTDYFDKVDGFKQKQQHGPISINSEVDRVYVDTESECVIEDASWQRRIHIRKCGSRSTVVWNPWQEKADAMGDMGDQGYLSMLCVESANAMHNAVDIAAGERHVMDVRYHVEKR